MSVLVVEKVWELLERDSLLPEGGRPKHLLWALHFMKVYPKQSPGCLAVGASAGAVDPKTHRKWVWAFIDAVANLDDVVVSKSQCGDRCGSDVLLKCRGSRGAGTPAPLLTATKASTEPKGSHFIKSASVRLRICLFSPTSGPHPPRCCPCKRISSSRADWVHTMCSTTAR